MIKLSPGVHRLLNQGEIESFYLVKVGDLRMTSFHRDLWMNGFQYTSSNLLFSIDPLHTTSSVDRGIYRLSLTDPTTENLAYYEASLVGHSFEVRIGFIDMLTGEPMMEDTLLVYKGVVEGFNYEIDTAELGEIKSEVRGSSPMVDLDAVKPFYTSKDFIKQLAVNDTAFDQIYEGAGYVNISWGK